MMLALIYVREKDVPDVRTLLAQLPKRSSKKPTVFAGDGSPRCQGKKVMKQKPKGGAMPNPFYEGPIFFPALSDEAEVKETKKEEPIPTPVPPPAKNPTQKEPKPEDKAKEKPKDEDKDQDKNKDKESKDKATEKPKEFRIDLDGIQNRIVALPTEPGVIRTLAAAKGFIYYSTTPIQGLSGPLPGESSVVHAYDLKEHKNKALMEQVERFALSFDGSKLLYEAEGSGGGHSYGIIDAKPEAQPKKIGDGALSLSSMRSEVDPT